MSASINSIKLRLQRTIAIITTVLFIGKLIAFFITNSIGILTDALESIVNVITAFISLYSIKVALKPQDDDHPFGHGKIEFLSASLEGFLIIVAGLIIIYEAFVRLFNPAEIVQLDIGIIIIAVAGLINYIMGYISIRMGKKHHSMALVAGGKHLHSDVYSTIGLVIGLIVLYITHIAWLDSAIAFIFGGIICYTGYKILQETTSNLMDGADFTILSKMTEFMWEHRKDCWIDIHNLKIVKYGATHHIDCDLRLPRYYNIVEAHAENDALKKVISDHYENIFDITIHIDACNDTFCSKCKVTDCKIRVAEFTAEEKWTIHSITFNSSKNI